jgi:dienelactone hydrolase
MKPVHRPRAALLAIALAGCGENATVESTGAPTTTPASSATAGGTGGSPAPTGTTTTAAGVGGAGGAATTPAPTAPKSDPNQDGPYAFVELDDEATVEATGDSLAIHCAYPAAGPAAGLYPVVLVAHGFNVPPSQYVGYVRRLASFGYVALTADYPTLAEKGILPNHVRSALDLAGAIDWVAARPEVAPAADLDHVGVTGHSLGGKLAFLAATLDPRIKAVIALDPVDGAALCDAAKCPDVSDQMAALSIPVGVLGEETDAAGGLAPCAPADDNFATFYASANSPALSVQVLGANHMSFLDDAASCGLACGVCKSPSLGNAVVNRLAKAFVVSFFERWLRGDARYDDDLFGHEATTRYVDPGLAVILSK